MAKTLAIAISLQVLIVLVIASMAQSRPVVTRLTVYLQEFLSGPNQTVFPIAGLPNTTWGVRQFGTVFVEDHALTKNISVNFPVVGHLRGLLAVASRDGVNAVTLFTILFTSGKYNGSTVEVKGINVHTNPVKETAIVVGTKQFRFATGYTTSETASLEGNHHIIRLNLTIVQDTSIRKDVEKGILYESVM